MATPEEIAQQYELLAAHRQTLTHLLIQRASLGASQITPGIASDIHAARASIRRTKQSLRAWDEPVADYPDDDYPLMDGFPVPDDRATATDRQQVIEQQLMFLAAYRGMLAHHLTQHAALGSTHVSPGIAYGIREARDNIRRIKAILRAWGTTVEDDPNDDYDPAAPAPEGPPRSKQSTLAEPDATGSILSEFPEVGWFTGRAENEHEVEGLVSSFVDIGCFKDVLGNTQRPESVILFAESGCGKTSHCVQVARRAAEGPLSRAAEKIAAAAFRAGIPPRCRRMAPRRAARALPRNLHAAGGDLLPAILRQADRRATGL